jgi:hypothetical protein
MSRFSRTDIAPNRRRPSGTSDRPRATRFSGSAPVTSSPNRRTDPALGLSRPVIDFMMVDLPAPLAPMMVTTWPLRTAMLTLRSAGTMP